MEDTTILPDIGDDGVYETSDVEEPFGVPGEVTNHRDIDQDPVNVSESRNKFAPEVLEASWLVDFLGNAGRPSLNSTGYRARGQEENTRARLARIERELAEIKLEVEGEEIDKYSLMVQYVTERMEKQGADLNGHWMRVKQALDGTTMEVREETRTQDPQELPVMGLDQSRILRLEEQITHMERMLGGAFNVQGVLLDLGRKVEMAAATLFEPLEKKISELNEQLEAAKERKTRLRVLGEETSSTSGAISELFDSLPEITRTAAMVPGLVERLQSLAVIHSDVGEVVTVSSSVDEALLDIRSEMSRWRAALESTNENLQSFQNTFAQNKTDVMSELDRWAASARSK